MTARPLSSSIVTGPVGSGGTTAQAARDWLAQLSDFVAQLPGGDEREALTITAGSITPTRATIMVETEAAAASDDLDSIASTSLPEGAVISIQSADASRQVTLRHAQGGADQIFLSSGTTFVLADPTMRIWFVRYVTGWVEIAREYGSSIGSFRSYLGLSDAATWVAASLAEAQAGTAADKIMTPLRVAGALSSAALMITNRTESTTPEATDFILVSVAGVLRKVQLANLPPARGAPDWTSGEIPYPGSATGAAIDVSATLSSIREVAFRLVMKDGIHGYQVGDTIEQGAFQNISVYRRAAAPLAIAYRFPPASDGIAIRNEDNGQAVSITATGDAALVIDLWGDPA